MHPGSERLGEYFRQSDNPCKVQEGESEKQGGWDMACGVVPGGRQGCGGQGRPLFPLYQEPSENDVMSQRSPAQKFGELETVPSSGRTIERAGVVMYQLAFAS